MTTALNQKKEMKREQKNYQCIITTDNTLTVAFESIAQGVNKWWAKNFEGSSSKAGDEFIVRFGATWVKFLVTEFIPDRKIEWKVIDCYLPFINHKTEWTDTSVVFEFEQKNDQVQITMTHIGLVPEAECYTMCNAGWNRHLKSSLYNLLTEGIGEPT